MSGPPHRSVDPSVERTISGVFVGVLVLLVGPTPAQQGLTNPSTGTEFSPTVQVIVSAGFTLVAGGFLLAFVPAYVERTTDRVRETPGETLLYGLLIFVAMVLVVVILVVTFRSVLVVAPIVVPLAVVGELGFLAAGRSVFDHRGPVLLVAVGISVICAAVPIFGSIVAFGLSSMGVGAAYLDYTGN